MRSPDHELRLAMLISGGGTTMHAIGTACQEGGPLDGLMKPVVVVTSKEGVDGIAKARGLKIPVEKVLRKDFPRGEEGVEPYGEALLNVLYRYQPDVVTLNGFLAQVSGEVIDAYEGTIFNQHPGNPTYFGGTHMYGRCVHAAAIIFNRWTNRHPQWTDVVAQRVHRQYDRGAVVKSERFEILPTDTAETLQARALPVEHKVQIALLHDVAEGTVREVRTGEPFIHPLKPWEHIILYTAKQVAIQLYPQG